MDTIQRLRVKAEKEGNLKSNEQQKVTTEKADGHAAAGRHDDDHHQDRVRRSPR